MFDWGIVEFRSYRQGKCLLINYSLCQAAPARLPSFHMTVRASGNLSKHGLIHGGGRRLFPSSRLTRLNSQQRITSAVNESIEHIDIRQIVQRLIGQVGWHHDAAAQTERRHQTLTGERLISIPIIDQRQVAEFHRVFKHFQKAADQIILIMKRRHVNHENSALRIMMA
jgi:hypothetical protein